MIQIEKVKSAWGNISWDLTVNGIYIGNYRCRLDAERAGEEHVCNVEREQRQMDEDLRLEYED